MNTIHITRAAKVFNLKGEGNPYPASEKAVKHLDSELSELELLVVVKNGVQTIVHMSEAVEQKLYTPKEDVGYFHELFVEKLTHDLNTTTIRVSNLEAIKLSGNIRVEQFFKHNSKYLDFMSPDHKKTLQTECLQSADASLLKLSCN